MITIKNGSKGEDVKILQNILNLLLKSGLTADGIFGAKTETAVKLFQTKNSLTSDGIVGNNTWKKISNIMNTIKNGSKGDDVKILQQTLNHLLNSGLTVDGIFGTKTETIIKTFQMKNGLVADGIVGNKTWEKLLGSSTTSSSTSTSTTTPTGLVIDNSFLSNTQYVTTKTNKDLIVLHHTAGWDNPYNTISSWNRDDRGRVATEYVIGGIKCTDGTTTYDGKIVRAFPEGYWGYHIGTAGVTGMDKRSVGIEVCNFGHIKDGKTYAGSVCQPSQIVTLSEKFRGYNQFHRYSNKQLESLKKLLLYIANRDNIDLHKGIYEWIKKQGVKAFDYQADAYYGRVKGMVTHANIRKDKEDMFPQPELIDMILSL